MFIRKLSPVLVLMFAMLAIGASSASGSTAVRVDPGGGLKGTGSTISNTSAGPWSGIFQSLGAWICNVTNVNISISNSSFITVIVGNLNQLTFTSCTDTIPVISISSCTLAPGVALPSITINANNDIGGTTTINDMTVRCSIAGSTTSFCYYTAASAVGVGSNAASTLTYPNVGVVGVSGAGYLGGAVCGASGSFSGQLRHIVETSTNRTITVTTT